MSLRKFNLPLLILLVICLIAVFLRSYMTYERFDFGHDGDLYSWIVKDVLVDKHFRLIGQLTSTPGIFIGPLFYYLITPFFLIANMNPTGSLVLPPLLGVLGVLSYFYVFKRLFNLHTGLIAAFIQAVLLSRIAFDRWIVPTMTFTIWEIWYFYCLIMIARGNFQVFWILGILIGLIWHINFSLAPTLIALMVALLFSKKIPNFKQISQMLVGIFTFSLPLLIFEYRHGFSQSRSFIQSFGMDQGGGGGMDKLNQVLIQLWGNINSLFFYPERVLPISQNLIFYFILILGLILPLLIKVKNKITIKNNLLSTKEVTILIFWILGVVGFFSYSSKIVTEYYLQSIGVIFLGILITILGTLFTLNKYGKVIVMLILLLILSKSIQGTFWPTDPYNHGYQEKLAVAEFIKQDSEKRGFKCIGVSYITSPGNEFGFRYLFYLQNLYLNKPSIEIPVYNIVYPVTLALDEIKNFHGAYGVIPPHESIKVDEVNQNCKDENTNLTDPLFGYTD